MADFHRAVESVCQRTETVTESGQTKTGAAVKGYTCHRVVYLKINLRVGNADAGLLTFQEVGNVGKTHRSDVKTFECVADLAAERLDLEIREVIGYDKCNFIAE